MASSERLARRQTEDPKNCLIRLGMTQPPVEDTSTDENQVQDMLLTYLLDGENKRSKQRHKKDPGTALV